MKTEVITKKNKVVGVIIYATSLEYLTLESGLNSLRYDKTQSIEQRRLAKKIIDEEIIEELPFKI